MTNKNSAMDKAQLSKLIIAAICDIAPDIEPEEVVPDEDLRDSLDLDSMDFLHLIVAVSKQTGIAIPEADYAQVLSLDDMCRYLLRH